MPTETTFRIDFHIEQTGLDVHGEASISPNPPTLNADITQEGLSLSGGQYIYPSIDDFITFGKWFKGDKGDKGEKGDKGDSWENDFDIASNEDIDALFD